MAVEFVEDPIQLVAVRRSVPLTFQASLSLEKLGGDSLRGTSDVFLSVLGACPKRRIHSDSGLALHEECDCLVDDLTFVIESLGHLVNQERTNILLHLRFRGIVPLLQGNDCWDRLRGSFWKDLLAATNTA